MGETCEPSPIEQRRRVEMTGPDQQRGGSDQVPERGVIGVEAVVVADTGRRARTERDVRIGCGRAVRYAMPEAESGVKAVPFAQIHLASAKIARYQPCALHEEHQQEDSGDPLRLADVR